MRYSYLVFGVLLLFLHLTPLSGQVEIDVQPDDRLNTYDLSNCIQFPNLDMPSSFTEDFYEISQTGIPFGNQAGYTHILNRSPSCIPSGNVVVSFAKTGNCEPRTTPYLSTQYAAEVRFNGKLIATRALSGIGNEVIQFPVEDLRLEHVSSIPSVHPLELHILSYNYYSGVVSTSSVVYQLAYIMVVENGSRLYFEHELPNGETVTEICNRVALQGLDDLLQNCNPSEEIRLNYELTSFNSNTSTASFTAGYQISASVGGSGNAQEGSINYGTTLQGSMGQSITFQDQQIISNSASLNAPIVLPPRGDSGCSFMGLNLIGKTVYLQAYTADCDRLEPGELSNESIVYTAIQPVACTEPGSIPEECFPAVIDFRVRREREEIIADGSGRNSSGDCTVSIITEQNPEPDYGQTMIWEGPDGFTVVGNGIEGGPLGVYLVTVYDECGDVREFTVDACAGGAVVSSWTFNGELNQFCRTITCDGGEECDGVVTVECRTPEFGEWEYDPATGTACRSVQCPTGEECDLDEQCVTAEFGPWDYYDNGVQTTCTRAVLVQGESIAQEEHQAILSYDYDEASNQCYEYVRCAAPNDILPELVRIVQDGPTFEEWAFETFSEVCVRRVLCFERTAEQVAIDPNVELENPANTDWENRNPAPEYLWEYDEGWGCVGYVFCDPFEAPVHPGNTDWELNSGQGFPVFTSVGYDELFGVISCVLDVDCEFNGQSYDTPEAFPPLTSEPIDPVSANFIGTPDVAGYCEFVYQCGDALPYTVDRPFVGEFVGTDADGNDLCVAYCEGFKATTSQLPVLCRDIDGFVNGSNVVHNLPNQHTYQLKWQTTQESRVETAKANPNPFQNEIILQNLPAQEQAVKVVLMNVDGRAVLEQTCQNLSTAKLNTTALATGVYLLVLLGENDEVLYERRLVKVE